MKWIRTLIFSALFFSPVAAMALEEPAYQVIETKGEMELRSYEPMIVAEVWVDGEKNEATSRGFRLIAEYIFGGNTSQSGAEQKIAMTAPVTIAEETSEKISMTAPVTAQKEGELWRIHFVMPSEYSMDTLPRPNNERVNLREVAAGNYAAIRFSGLTGEKKVAEKTAELIKWMEANDLQPKAEPELARYNPPWTLPFMRRNEVLIRY